MSDAQQHVCVLTDCENGILHEYDCNDSFGNHTTGVIYCPVCHPEQYEPDSDPLIAAAPEMLEALRMFLAYNDQGAPLSFDTDAMWARARSVVAKIERGGE